MILILGGDGFCGWPCSLYLSNHGFDVCIVDNLSRRHIDTELGVTSLTPIQPIEKRLAKWKELTGKEITFHHIDIATNYHRLLTLLCTLRPEVVIHFAEQRAAPYSMKSATHKRYTVNNNVNGTNNLLAAIVESGLDIHVIHLGTMGVYGYTSTGIPIPEGYLSVHMQNVEGNLVEQEILYPPHASSIYHMTKSLDQLLFSYYNQNDHIRITDLHQGIVWGTETSETSMDEILINRFDYDGDYGTVLNRFLVQAAIGHPLTVYGSGGQTRAFIHISDTVQCVKLAIENPPDHYNRVCIRNQLTEIHKIRDLAHMISEITGTPIAYLENPRNEAPENEMIVAASSFIPMGLNPVSLDKGLLAEAQHIAQKYAHNADRSKIRCVSYWNKERALAISRKNNS